MVLTLNQVRELLARQDEGETLSDAELANLSSSARTLQRRLARLQAVHPELMDHVALSARLDELAQPPVLTASG
jgi:hypothetical protein